MTGTRARVMWAWVVCAVALLAVSVPSAQTGGAAASGPTLVLETAKGTIEIRMYQAESPKSVEKILGLVKRGFYRGQRIHRVERSLVQFGDPSSRDVSRKDWWGRTSRPSSTSDCTCEARSDWRTAATHDTPTVRSTS
jgi:hypothetical protein